MENIQKQYDELIRLRDPDQVRALWEKTEIPPNEENLKLMLEVGKAVQRCMEAGAGKCLNPNIQPETQHLMLHAAIRASIARSVES